MRQLPPGTRTDVEARRAQVDLFLAMGRINAVVLRRTVRLLRRAEHHRALRRAGREEDQEQFSQIMFKVLFCYNNIWEGFILHLMEYCQKVQVGLFNFKI